LSKASAAAAHAHAPVLVSYTPPLCRVQDRLALG